MTTIHEAFKQMINENNGSSFSKLNKMFWLSVIDASLEITNGNKKDAAKLLGINRQTLAKRIAMYHDRT